MATPEQRVGGEHLLDPAVGDRVARGGPAVAGHDHAAVVTDRQHGGAVHDVDGTAAAVPSPLQAGSRGRRRGGGRRRKTRAAPGPIRGVGDSNIAGEPIRATAPTPPPASTASVEAAGFRIVRCPAGTPPRARASRSRLWNCPSPPLQLKHRMPRTAPVSWAWSTCSGLPAGHRTRRRHPAAATQSIEVVGADPVVDASGGSGVCLP